MRENQSATSPAIGQDQEARRTGGLTLAELLITMAIVAIDIAVLLSSFMGQMTLNEHARYLSLATNDAVRVMEQLRQQNSPGVVCTVPNVAPPAGFLAWDAWLGNTTANGGGGKSLPASATDELVVVSTPVVADPIRVTVAICWRHKGRIIGECTWNGAALTANPAAGNDPNVTESPAMLVTAITCRQ